MSSETAEATPPDIGSNGCGIETELKLLVDPADMPVFLAAPAIAGNARGPGVRRRLRAVYYDTPDRRLRRAGLVLRVRRSGQRFVQTVKSDAGDDPLRRGEWQAPVPGPEPDVALALPLLPEKLRAKLASAPLLPVFTTDIRRLVRSVVLPSGTVEVAFDLGRIEAGDAALPVAEIELELKQGGADALYALALGLLEAGPARPSIRGKADRGFDLADGRPPAAAKPQPPRIAAGTPLDDALAAILRGILRHLLAAIPAAEDGRGGDGVHQTRVALRRLRSLAPLIRAVNGSARLEAFHTRAARIAEALGAAREHDVFLDETLPRVEAAIPSLHGFTALRNVMLGTRAEAYDKVRALLAGRETARFLLELGAWTERRGWRAGADAEARARLADPAASVARHTLDRLHAKVLKRGKSFKSMTPDSRHELRIAVKKLRYGIDFLAPLVDDGKALRRYSAVVVTLQDRLGRYNDMATTARLLSGLEDGPADRLQAAGAIIGWQARGLATAEARLRDAWRHFRRLPLFWAPAP